MAFWSRSIKRSAEPIYGNTKETIQNLLDAINLPGFSFTDDDARRIIALTICSRILAQDIGRLPLKIYRTDKEGNKTILKDDYRYLLLHNHPNSYLDTFTFKSTLEYLRDFDGNSYARIHRDESLNIDSFEIIPDDRVVGPVLRNNELWYGIKEKAEDTKYSYELKARDILHFRNISSDGLRGRDPKEDLSLNLGISFKALTVLDNFYSRGAIGNLTLESVIPEGVDALEWSKQNDFFAEKFGGYLNSNKLFVTPPFTKLVPININFADAQLIETIKYNNGQVAAYYQIPAYKIGISESTKFNDLLQLNLDYLKNTLGPIMEMYRREYELKLLSDEEINDGYSIEFEANAMLITDSKTRMENYKNLFGLGAITPNQIAKYENFPSFPGGDDHYLMSNYQSVEAYNAKLKNNSSNIQQSAQIE